MHRPIHAYSTVLCCLYDEQEPVGYLGRGTHYSVLRCVEPLDVDRNPAQVPQIHDFAVIWDEDHDTRIISLVEQLYMANLLSPVQFIGERKGMVTIITAARWHWSSKQSRFEQWKTQVETIAASGCHNDSWNVSFRFFDRSYHPDIGSHQTDIGGIIADSDVKVEMYLRNIDNLWRLGTRAFQIGDNCMVSGRPIAPPVPQGVGIKPVSSAQDASTKPQSIDPF